ncbi:tRNA threonylcarbamoyladenosine dehydratase [bioreactor metagenome]|uniref:tRNA threonylcarbamoyladenosine dehydratase n=1 Tax=bioreactor metagenome TaxID=1076179 RepID=A0A645DMC7_9ZZZZ
MGAIDLFDDDLICLTNLNRQLMAVHSTIGKKKTEVMRARILDINPRCDVRGVDCFYGAETDAQVPVSEYSYIIDAIDTISSKLLLVQRAGEHGVPIISCMGAGNKLDPSAFRVSDIFKTSVCPVARVMRRELRQRGIKSLKVVYSQEQPMTPLQTEETSCKNNCVCPPGSRRSCNVRRQVPGSVSFVPPVAGFILAGEVIRDLCAGAGTRA